MFYRLSGLYWFNKRTFLLQSLLLLSVLFLITENQFSFLRQRANVILLRDIATPDLPLPEYSSQYLRAVATYHRGNYVGAVDAFEHLSRKNDELNRHWIALSLDASGEWQQAVGYLDPKNMHERRLIASILLHRLPEMEESQKNVWEQFIRDEIPEFAWQYAAFFLARGEYENAELWARIVPDYNQSMEVQLILGQSYFYRSGQMDKAIETFTEAYQRFPGPATAYWLGRSLSYTGHPDSAIPLLQEAASASGQQAIGSAFGWYILELASAYAKSGKCEDALVTIKRFDALTIPSSLRASREQIVEQCK